MKISDLLNERVESRNLRDAAFTAVFSAVKNNDEPNKIIKEIETALQFVSEPYCSQWKSGIKNARGYEFNKITLDISVDLGDKTGAGYTSKTMDFDGNKLRIGKIYFTIYPYEELFGHSISNKFSIEFSHAVANAFAHEMIHYTQEVKHRPNLNDKQRSAITKAQSMPLHREESINLSDEQRDQYYAKINEIDAYAANAASDLINSLGIEKARSMMKNITSLAEYSSVIARFVKRVKDKRPKAWKRFMTQLAWNLDHYSESI